MSLAGTADAQARDWTRAARALLSGCVDLRDGGQRLALLEQVCRGLGDALYPDFLTLLAHVGEHGDAQACGVVAATLLEGLRTGRVPSGRRHAWGSGPGGAWRSLGPLEYLCAARDRAGQSALIGQAGESDLSGEARFQREGAALLRLVDADGDARRLYIERLRALADDPLEGGLSRQAREGLRLMAGAWAEGHAPDVVCQRFLGALAGAGGSGLSALAARRW